jgi:hypothetical protein
MSERMQRYIETQKERGFKLVAVWVPLDKVERLRKTAERWRRDSGHVTLRANMLYRKKRTKK